MLLWLAELGMHPWDVAAAAVSSSHPGRMLWWAHTSLMAPWRWHSPFLQSQSPADGPAGPEGTWVPLALFTFCPVHLYSAFFTCRRALTLRMLRAFPVLRSLWPLFPGRHQCPEPWQGQHSLGARGCSEGIPQLHSHKSWLRTTGQAPIWHTAEHLPFPIKVLICLCMK